jgi:D-sedoheptulose 7-phosphate isomerase
VVNLVLDQLSEAARLLDNFLKDHDSIVKIEAAAELMASAINLGGKIMSCGNGGSHCDAMHFAEELTGKFRDERKALPAIAIADTSHITCVGNDYGFDHIFARYVEGLGRQYDVLLAISTSGNSTNIINAVQAAKEKGMKVVALTGKQGGKLADLADIEIRVPHNGFSDRIQEIHIKVIHIIILLIEQKVIQ